MANSTIQSAVRLPTPPLETASIPLKRKGSFSNSSPHPATKQKRAFQDVDPERGAERERQYAERLRQEPEENAKPLTDAEKQQKAKEEYQRLLQMRSGGTYIPPARLRALQAQVTDKTSKEYQRMAWEALKKSINGLINKVNVSNIKHIVPELFAENLVRGRGLFCVSIMKAQAASLPFTPIYAAMAAIVNTKLPQVGELLMNRLIVQFRKAFKRNDKTVCLSSSTFIAHLCNQQVIHELIAAHILQLLLSNPTDDSVEIAVGLIREVGQQLEEMSAPIAILVFDQFRNILHEADIDKRTQYMIEVLFQVRKDQFKDNPAVREELDLVEEEDQITHKPPAIDDPDIDVETGLNIFKYDSDYEEHEEAYRKLKAEILGEDSDASGSDASSDASDEASEDEREREMEIKDQSNTDLTNLRRTIYLTINSSADFEECCHKLMKLNIPPGLESELPSMIIETCSQRPTYEKFYGLIGERFARLNRLWTNLFEEAFVKYYDTIHRYETNRLRNIARFFGHIISSDGIGWHVFSVIHLNEEETTSSSRIFIKILFQDLAEAMGMAKLQARLKEETLQPSFAGLFPRDDPRNIRFSINYFTSIGMGAVTEDLREYLKNMPKPVIPTLPAAASGDRSDSGSVSSYSSGYDSRSNSSRSRSRSRSSYGSRSRSDSRSPSRSRRGRSTRGRRRSYTPSISKSGSESRSRSRSRSVSNSHARSHRQSKRRSLSHSVSESSRSPSRSKTPPRSRRRQARRQSSASASTSRSRSRSPEPPKRQSKHHDSPGRADRSAEREPRRQARRRRGSSVASTEAREQVPRKYEQQKRPPQSKSPSDDVGKSRGTAPGRKDKRGNVNGKRERSLSPYSRRAAMAGR